MLFKYFRVDYLAKAQLPIHVQFKYNTRTCSRHFEVNGWAEGHLPEVEVWEAQAFS